MNIFGFQFLVKNFWVSLLVSDNLRPSLEISAKDKNGFSSAAAEATNKISYFNFFTTRPNVKLVKSEKFIGRSYDTAKVFPSRSTTQKLTDETLTTANPTMKTEMVTDALDNLEKPKIEECRHSHGYQENPDKSNEINLQKEERDFLICIASGRPLPTVIWLHNKQVAPQVYSKQIGERKIESAFLFPLEFLFMGGNYSFIAVNPIGSAKQEFYLSFI